MAEIREVLDAVRELIRDVKPAEAEARLTALIKSLGNDDLQHWKTEIESVSKPLLKKRHKQVCQLIEDRLTAYSQNAGVDEGGGVKGGSERESRSPDQIVQSIAADFSELSHFHIFQWATYYRDYIERAIASLVNDLPAPKLEPALDRFRDIVASHAEEIFERGFRFKVEEQHRPEITAHLTAITGLQRFCELAVEHYSSAAIKIRESQKRIILRKVVSGFLSAALSSFAGCSFGARTGTQLMAAHRVQWVHYLAFLDSSGADRLAAAMGQGTTGEIIRRYLRPIAYAIDKASLVNDGDVWLPQISQYFHDQRRLEILLHSPRAKEHTKLVEVFVLVDSDVPALSTLKEAEARGVKLIVCGLKADVAASAMAERLQNVIVNCLESGQDASAAQKRALAILKGAIIQGQGGQSASMKLEYNFTRIFPLNNPFQSRYFHVVRRSVRSLLREIEGRSGVRLWCSVRRSGKTTACFDLGGALPGTDVIVQTCDNTHNDESASSLFEQIVAELESGRAIPKNFFRDAVSGLKVGGSPNDRVILILDEYETLFGRLRRAARFDPDVLYAVVYPLLSQMVAYSRDNMIVFVGQQPNAHFIFMEQNPLSAYVKQDSFPLFAHSPGSSSSEFSDLVEKVLTEQWSATGRFMDSLYGETAGHPFLTVNLIVSFVEWLIAKDTKVGEVKFDSASWSAFAESELAYHKIALNTEFQFFLEAASDAMGETGKATSPWLWSLYRSIRHFAEEFGARGSCALNDFVALYQRMGLGSSGIAAEEVLRTGADSNFLSVTSDGWVSVGIPLLARIAASATPRID